MVGPQNHEAGVCLTSIYRDSPLQDVRLKILVVISSGSIREVSINPVAGRVASRDGAAEVPAAKIRSR